MSTIERLLKEELEAGFPIYISGMNRSGGKLYGHAWVVDGVDADGLFHMNLAGTDKAMATIRSDALPQGKQGMSLVVARSTFPKGYKSS